ncbi:MAG: deoxyribose-phosphate aldolase [Flavobacterium sp.]|nr:deoxyribose-phosphate aldolase [Flavobacterium sp.]
MEIRNYLDSTFLKLPAETGLADDLHDDLVRQTVLEAIDENFAAVVVRPDQVVMANKLVDKVASTVAVCTVIGFPKGTDSISDKLSEAKKAIENGADELDFVVNYQAFINGNHDLIREEIYNGTLLCRSNNRVIKWIIETAALDISQIAQLSALIKNVILTEFQEDDYASVFVKSSTGYYKTSDGSPSGATPEAVITMLENAAPLPVKASGGIKTYDDALQYINLGVKRLGTSAAKIIAYGGTSNESY